MLLASSAALYAQRNHFTLEWTPTKMLHARVPALELGVGLILAGDNHISYHRGFQVGIHPTSSPPKGVDQDFEEWRIRYNRLVRFSSDPTDFSGFLYGLEYGVLTEKMIYPTGTFTTDEDNVRFAHDGFQRTRVLKSQRAVLGLQYYLNRRLYIQYTLLLGVARQTRTSRYEGLREEPASSSGCGFCIFGSGPWFELKTASTYLHTTAPEHRERLFYPGLQIRLFYRLVAKTPKRQ